MSARLALLLASLLTGCVADEFVIFGETDGCSSSGAGEADEIDAAPVSKSVPAEMSSRPGPRARSTTSPRSTARPPRPGPQLETSPVTMPAQERR